MSEQPITAREAATIALVRDAAQGIEVFMVVRHPATAFAAGAMVFPGGAVEAADRDDALRERVAAGVRDLPAAALALRVAAVREVYEEAGVLLARGRGEAEPIGSERLAAIDRRHAGQRARHAVDIAALARAEDLELACDLMVPFAHWITPPIRPKRFDTHFYLAPAPFDQNARHDGHESVDSAWVEPDAVCAHADAGEIHLMFPTRMNLMRLGRSATVADAIAASRARAIVTVTPSAERVAGGRRLRIPEAAGYGVTEVVVDERGVILDGL